MCDACLALGTPWLPALHGDRPRPRAARTVLRLRVRKAKPKEPGKNVGPGR